MLLLQGAKIIGVTSSCREILVLLFDRARTVDLRVDQGVGHADVVVADMRVVGPNVVGELSVPVTEFIGRRGEPGDEYVHEIGAAAEHPAGRIHPDLHHLAPTD
jgi:hypothetical protein